MIIQHLRNYLTKIKINTYTYLYFVYSFLYMDFRLYLSIMFFVFLHEICHVITAYYFKYKVNEIEIYPFGTCANIKGFMFKNPFKELLIVLAGPLSHVFFIFILHIFKFDKELIYINLYLMIFNLLPIYPLDGSKILMIVFQMSGDLKKSMYMTLKTSVLCLSVFILYYFKIDLIIVFIFLINYQLKLYFFIPKYLYDFILTNTDQKNKKCIINDKIIYRRGYRNFYLLDNRIYDKESVKYTLLKQTFY